MPDMQQLQAVVNAVGWTLIHFLWQGLLIAFGLWLICRLSRPEQARMRYWAGLGAYLACAVAPAVTLVQFLSSAQAPAATGSLALPSVSPVNGYHVSTGQFLELALEPVLPIVVALWALGVGVLSSRTFLGWLGMRRLLRIGARPVTAELRGLAERMRIGLGVRRVVTVMRSTRVAVPTVVGWLKPVILLPASVIARLPREQLEMIIAHELAHVRRNDYIVNLVQLVIETLFFYHPAVRWMSRQVRQEREHCCDDMVVARCGKPVVYARALANLEVMRAPMYRVSVAATDGDLFHRVSRIVRRELPRRSAGFAQVAVIAVAAAAAAVSARQGIEMGLVRGEEIRATTDSPDWIATGRARTDSRVNPGEGLRLYAERPQPVERQPRSERELPESPAMPAEQPVLAAEQPAGSAQDGGGDPAEWITRSLFAGPEVSPLLLARAESPVELFLESQREPDAEAELQPTARPVATQAPDYPYRAYRDGVEGHVKLQFTVSVSGRVRDVRVLEADPPRVFEEAAISALKRWRFEVEPGHDPSLRLLQTFEFAALNSQGNATQRHRRCNRTGSNICGKHYSEEHVMRFGPEGSD